MNEAQVSVGPTDHHTYLGASDIGAVAEQSQFKTSLDVWAEKKGIAVKERDPDDGEIRPVDVGNAFERPAIELYALRKGVEVTYPGTLRHPEFGWAGATPDAIEDGRLCLQCKIVGPHMLKFWGEPSDGPDGIPADTLCQVHWETWIARAVLGIPGEVAKVLAAKGTSIPDYEIPIDDGMIEGLVEIGREFWEKHVIGGEMPVIEGDHASDILAAIHPRHMRDKLDPMTAEVEKLAREYDDARDAEKEADAHQKQIGAQLKALIGEGAGYQGNGVTATWKTVKGSPSWKKIAEAAGATREIIKRCTPEFGARKLHVKIK